MPHGAIPFPFGSCRICEDRATGFHYGAATCEGCKGFFKRSLPKRDKFTCFFGGQCKITPFNRNRCKACRFKRCLDNGMAVEAVKMGRIPKVEKERALFEANCSTTAGVSAAPGSDEDEMEMDLEFSESGDHDGGFPNHPSVPGSAGLPGSAREMVHTASSRRQEVAGSSSTAVSASVMPPSRINVAALTGDICRGQDVKNTHYNNTLQINPGDTPDVGRIQNSSFYSSGNVTCAVGLRERNVSRMNASQNIRPQVQLLSGTKSDFFETSPATSLSTDNALDASMEAVHFGGGFKSTPVFSSSGLQHSINTQLSQTPWNGCHPSGHHNSLVNTQSRCSPTPLPFSSSFSSSSSSPLTEVSSSISNHISQGIDSFSKNNPFSQISWPRHSNMPSNSEGHPFSTEVKREVFESQQFGQESQPMYKSHDTATSNCMIIPNNELNSSCSSPEVSSNGNLFRPNLDISPTEHNSAVGQYFSESSSHHESRNLRTTSGNFCSDVNTVHCDNPFSQPAGLRAVSTSAQFNRAAYPSAGYTSHTERDNLQRHQSLPGCHVTYDKTNDKWPAFSTSSRTNFAEPLRFPQETPSAAHAQKTCVRSTSSVSENTNGVTESASSEQLASGARGKRAAYSPDVVKILLNQVGFDRLQGLKQHIMTSIAPDCCPEEFQAAADLLTNYSQPLQTRAPYGRDGDNVRCGFDGPGQDVNIDKAVSDISDQFGRSCSSGLASAPTQSMAPSSDSGQSIRATNQHPAVHEDCSRLASSTGTNRPNQAGSYGQHSERQTPPHVFLPSNETIMSKVNYTIGVSYGNDAALPSGGVTNTFPDLVDTESSSTWTKSATESSVPTFDRAKKFVLPEQDDSCLLNLDTADLLTDKCENRFFIGDESTADMDTRSTDKASIGSISQISHSDNDTNSPHRVPAPSGETSLSELALTLSSAFHTHMAIFTQKYADMELMLREGRPIPVHPVNAESKVKVYEQLIASIADINKAIIGFCNCVPGILALPKADKDYLTKRAYYDIWMLTNSRLFHEGQTYMQLPDGTYYSREWMETILNKQIVQVFFKFAVAFNSLELSDLELAILCAIQLTSPGHENPGEPAISGSSREQVKHINSQLVDLLVHEVGLNHASCGPRILVDTFRLLPDLAEINSLQQNIIANFSTRSCPENVSYSPKPAPLADLSEDQLNSVLKE